jgi:hypothetical protein
MSASSFRERLIDVKDMKIGGPCGIFRSLMAHDHESFCAMPPFQKRVNFAKQGKCYQKKRLGHTSVPVAIYYRRCIMLEA